MDAWLIGATAISIFFAIVMVWIAVRDHRRRAESAARVEMLQALAAEQHRDPAPTDDEDLELRPAESPRAIVPAPVRKDSQFVVTIPERAAAPYQLSFDRRTADD